MSYGVALRNGIPFTLGTIAALCVNATGQAWSPAALWPTGTEPGMWIDPSNLTSQWQDSIGTTPVATPGTVADSSNPCGLALDLRLGALDALGPELVVNGDFATDLSGWTVHGDYVATRDTSVFPAGAMKVVAPTSGMNGRVEQFVPTDSTKQYSVSATFYSPGSNPSTYPQGCLSLYAVNDIALWPGVEDEIKTVQWHVPGAVGSLSISAIAFAPYREWAPAGCAFYITNISVREIPGNHLLQATSTARPLLSGRVNLLTYTEDFGNAAWHVLFDLEKTPNYALAPDGSMTACRLYAPTADGVLYGHGVTYNTFTRSVWVKSNTASNYTIVLPGNPSITVTPTWTLVSGSEAGNNYLWNMSVLAGGDISIWHPQTELGTTATPYQVIPGDGSTYSSTGFPIYQKYDGTDDGMATATFAAGTLTSAMDCMIAVRRDSGTAGIAGLSDGAPNNKFFGFYHDIDNVYANYMDCGTPTTWVDGVQLTGGTATTRAAFYTALADSGWHVAEWRGLDLSGWTAAAVSAFLNIYRLNGGQGGILLFPSSTSAADRDAARTWLGAKVGLTL